MAAFPINGAFRLRGINPAGDQRGCSPPLDSPFDGARSKLRGILDSTYYNRLWGVNVGCRCIGSNCEQNRSSHSGVTVRGINLGRAAHTSFYITWSIRSPRHRRRVDEKSILALPYYYHSGKSGRASTQHRGAALQGLRKLLSETSYGRRMVGPDFAIGVFGGEIVRAIRMETNCCYSLALQPSGHPRSCTGSRSGDGDVPTFRAGRSD